MQPWCTPFPIWYISPLNFNINDFIFNWFILISFTLYTFSHYHLFPLNFPFIQIHLWFNLISLIHSTFLNFLLMLSVQFSCSVVSDSLWAHGLQHGRPPCPSLSPGVCPSPCPLSLWYHPAISSSVAPFSSHLQTFPASRSLQMSQLFISGVQNIGVSASISALPMNTQD